MKYKINNYIVDAKSPIQALKAIKKIKDYGPPYSIYVKENGKWVIWGGTHSINIDKKAFLEKGYEDVTVVKNGESPKDSQCKDTKIIKLEELKEGDKFKDPYGDDKEYIVEKIDLGSDGDYEVKSIQSGIKARFRRDKRVLIDSVKDSQCKDANITPDELRRFCIKHNYYTSGNIQEYDNLLSNTSKWDLREIASDIAQHSRGVWATEVWSKLKETFGDSIKDEESLEEKIHKAQEWVDFDIKHHGEVSELTKKDIEKMGLKYDKWNNQVTDSDAETEYLSQEEEQAIEDYKNAIAKTKDVKLLRIYAHILKEEVEHLEELQNEELIDSCKRK